MCSGKCLESCGSLAVVALCVRSRSCIVIVEPPVRLRVLPIVPPQPLTTSNGNTFPIPKCVNQVGGVEEKYSQTEMFDKPTHLAIFGERGKDIYLAPSLAGYLPASFRQMPLRHPHMKCWNAQQSKLIKQRIAVIDNHAELKGKILVGLIIWLYHIALNTVFWHCQKWKWPAWRGLRQKENRTKIKPPI